MNKLHLWRVWGVLSLGLAAAFPLASSAQTTTANTGTSASNDQAQVLEKYTVTGSNIPTTLTAAEAGTYPLVAIDRRLIDLAGYQNSAELLQKLTVANAGAIPISNNATGFTPGATGVSIHGLGPEATLVLVNGHRVANFPVGQSGDTAFVDLNTIPLGMIDRIDVLKDGASAVYGADAVAGVVNIILRKNYEGTEAYVGYQNTTNKDSAQFTANLVTGVASEQGSLTVGFNYQKRNPISNADRSYSAVPAFLSSNSNPINAQLSKYAFADATGAATVAPPAGVTGDVFFGTPGPISSTGLPVASSNNGNVAPADWIYGAGRPSHYNYNQDAWAFPAWSRYGAILNGEHRIFGSPNLKAYIDASAQHSYTENQLAPAATGDFLTAGQTTLVIPARTANPILTYYDANGDLQTIGSGAALPADAQGAGPGTQIVNGLAQRIAAAGAYNPNNPFNQDITDGTRFRLKEFGNRILRSTNQAFMVTAGIRADNLFEKYNLDAGIRYSELDFTTNDTQVSAARFNDVLNAASNVFVTHPNFTPYNPFGYYANPIAGNASTVDYATIHLHDGDNSSLGNAYLTLNTSELLTLPGGDVGAAVGFDYRIERLQQSPDTENSAGDVIGSSPAAVTDHTRKVWATFAEISIPITGPKQAIVGAYSLSVDVAGRYEDFITSHDHAAVPKIGIRYQPVNDSLTFRASASKGFLEPSLYKLYAGSIASLLGLVDPRTNVENPEVAIVTTGNSHLKAETTKAYSAGVIWSPKWRVLDGFTTNIDFWRIERDGTALLPDFQDTLNRWNTGGLIAGEQVFLDAGGNISQVVAPYRNIGEIIADGVDLGASYLLNTGFGRFDFSASMSYLHSFRQSNAPNQPLVQYVDTTQDGEGQDAYLRRKGRVQTIWSHKNWNAEIAGNFLDSFQNYDLDGNQVRTGSSWTWDGQLSYTFKDEVGPYLKDTKVTIGGINLLNRHPPLSQYQGANPNNYPGFIYTAEDRMLYVSLDKKF